MIVLVKFLFSKKIANKNIHECVVKAEQENPATW